MGKKKVDEVEEFADPDDLFDDDEDVDLDEIDYNTEDDN